MHTIRRFYRLSSLLLVAAIGVLILAGCAAAAPAPASEMSAAPGDMARASFSEGSAAAPQQDASASSTTSALLNRKMTARATLDMVVADAGESVAAIEAIMAEVGGFIANENLYNESFGDETPRLRGSLTLRVPAEQLEPTLDRLAALAIEVGNRTLTREDVTDQYTDLDAQLRNLQATEAELLEMLAEVRAKPNAKPEDILAVHNRVMEIRGQIEQVQGRKNLLDNLIGLSTIDVTLAPDRSMLPVVESGWRPGAVARDALRLLVTTLQGLANFVIWLLVYILPVLLLILIPIVLVILAIRWLWRRRRREAASAE